MALGAPAESGAHFVLEALRVFGRRENLSRSLGRKRDAVKHRPTRLRHEHKARAAEVGIVRAWRTARFAAPRIGCGALSLFLATGALKLHIGAPCELAAWELLAAVRAVVVIVGRVRP